MSRKIILIKQELLLLVYELNRSGLLDRSRSEERFSRNAETDLVCRLLLEKKNEQNRNPIEVIVPDSWSASARVGFRVRRARVAGDVVTVRGFPATTVCRTLADLCRRRSLTEGVVFVDMALIAGRVDLDALRTWVRERSGWNGIKAFKRAVLHADPGAESPMETRLRMLLVRGRLPRPQTQVSLTAADGTFLGRVDLFYLEPRLGIEYDG